MSHSYPPCPGQGNNFTIVQGDCISVMRSMPDCSVDAVITDPPYELGFMGKDWDSTGIAFNPEVWKEALRVLKPGGHLLSFGGSRTYHRMACAIEDAGFEIRDQIMWVYGSGFPKSHNISKALDKMDAVEEQKMRRYRFTEWVRSTGITSKQINEATGTMMGSHYTTHASQPAIMTREHLELCRHLIKEIPEWVEREADIRTVESKNFSERAVIGTYAEKSSTPGFIEHRFVSKNKNITASNTLKAKEWEGWGTALKPAHEPICLARKPLEGTVAENVLRWGVGGLNIDGCRVGTEDAEGTTTTGRFPANLMHDGSQQVLDLFPENAGAAAPVRSGHSGESNGIYNDYAQRADDGATFYGNKGSAARFFYCPKASKSDRDNGCEDIQPKRESDRISDSGSGGDNPRNRTNKPRINFHPTVKPTELMRYLCRLITPKGGKVLDPFNGSGSTGKAALLEGMSYVGIDLNPEYIEIANARLTEVSKQILNK